MSNRLRPRTNMSLGGLSLAAARRWDVETDGGTRFHDLGGGRWFLRDARHRSFPGHHPCRRGPATARPLGPGRRTTGLGNLTVDQLEATLRSLFPNEAYILVRDQIARIQGEPPLALLSLGAVIALWSASNLFLVVIDALNRTYGVKETRSYVRLRLTAMAMTLLQTACLLGSLVAIAAWPQILMLLGLDPHARWHGWQRLSDGRSSS